MRSLGANPGVGLAAAALTLGLLSSVTAHAVTVELTGVTQLATGGRHACVVTSSGGVQCWGNNFLGQLGDGTQIISYPFRREAANDVVGLTSGVSAVAVSRGFDAHCDASSFCTPAHVGHSCAVTVAGGVKCWGENNFGQLGDGTNTRRLTPVDVIGLPAAAVSVAAGWYHTCAVLTGGALHCWGRNDSGELGDGTTTLRFVPAVVSGLESGVVEVTAGPSFTCAITSTAGAKCWGVNQRGQLGDGTTTDRRTPVDVTSLTSGVAHITAGGTPPQGVAAEYGGHTCAATTAGGVKCWGFNRTGQLGEGSLVDHLTPFDVTGLTSGALQVSAAGLRTPCSGSATAFSCGLISGGGVKCWGSDHSGALGNGGAPFCGPGGSSIPVDVVGLPGPATAVSAGGAMACALVSDGRVFCWGEGYASSAAQPIMSGPLPQTIEFEAASRICVGCSGTVGARASSELHPVTFTSLTPGICSVSGTTVVGFANRAAVSGLAFGWCTIAANQGGNAYYDPAPQVTQVRPIGGPASQTITFGAAPTVYVDTVGTLSATASSGLPVSFFSNSPSICSVSGSTVAGLAVGSCTVTATQAGDDLYAPATPQVTQTFPVGANNGMFALAVSRAGAGTGTVTSSPAGIACGATCAANFSSGAVVTLGAVPAGGSYFTGWGGACTGTGACNVTMSAVRTVTATFGQTDTDVPRLANLSTRMQVLTGNDVMIGGFVIGGPATKRVAIVATGPSLSAFGITNPLADPTIALVRSSDQAVVASNDNWQTASNAADLTAAGFAPSNPLEAAILVDLAPGAYTAIVQGVNNGTGVSVIGVYEVDHPGTPLINISTRGRVLTGNDVMIGGFVITGSGPQTVAIVATGPSLANFGITNPLANPTIALVRSSDQAVIDSNDDWQAHANASQLQAACFAPTNPLESGIYTTLPPGAYTAVVQGAGGGTGVAVIGVYKAPAELGACAF
jgi:alpha-tubulin suppressor-like RCC1 family protein